MSQACLLGKPSLPKTRSNLEIFQIGWEGGSEGWHFQKITITLFFADLGRGRGGLKWYFTDFTDLMSKLEKLVKGMKKIVLWDVHPWDQYYVANYTALLILCCILVVSPGVVFSGVWFYPQEQLQHRRVRNSFVH